MSAVRGAPLSASAAYVDRPRLGLRLRLGLRGLGVRLGFEELVDDVQRHLGNALRLCFANQVPQVRQIDVRHNRQLYEPLQHGGEQSMRYVRSHDGYRYGTRRAAADTHHVARGIGARPLGRARAGVRVDDDRRSRRGNRPVCCRGRARGRSGRRWRDGHHVGMVSVQQVRDQALDRLQLRQLCAHELLDDARRCRGEHELNLADELALRRRERWAAIGRLGRQLWRRLGLRALLLLLLPWLGLGALLLLLLRRRRRRPRRLGLGALLLLLRLRLGRRRTRVAGGALVARLALP